MLLERSEARYPEQAERDRLEATVQLELILDATGTVKDAKVLTEVGHGFDEAALEAAYRLRFKPAERSGQPVAARILYEHVFRLSPLDESAAAEPSSSSSNSDSADAPPTPAPPSANGAEIAPETIAPQVTSQPAIPAKDAAAALEIVVKGQSAADNLRSSSRSVKVVETEKAKRESADLGQVLARSEGVSVRRTSGLGSEAQLSLNGMSGDQVRFFLDGVPLALAGYPTGISNVPVNLVERIDIYAGVVPVELGADALGGAVNLVTDHRTTGTHATGSYQVGSFGTHRLTASARTLHAPTGLFARLEGFHDQSLNNYDVEVEVADELGRPYMATVPRFHDAYRASGGSLEVGLVDRPYAQKLIARVFLSDYDKEVQNNFIMAVPYGEVTFGETSYGASLRYVDDVSEDVHLELLVGRTRTISTYLDVGTCFYTWFGCHDPDTSPGEIEGQPHDQIYYQNATLGRATLTWHALAAQTLRVNTAPSWVDRTGDERRQPDPSAPDPLGAKRKLTTWVNGVEWETKALSDLIENIAFAKSYQQSLEARELVSGGLERDKERNNFALGYGDSLRVRATDFLYFKASYEYATRLPEAHEVFGDGRFVTPNLKLGPERSKNGNLGAYAALGDVPRGSYRGSVNGFVRDVTDQIVLLGDDRKQTFQNVRDVRCLGVEGALGWTSPRRYVALDGNATYQSLRNASESGAFARYNGDRLPNRPYFFANGSATFTLDRPFDRGDELSLSWYTSYVHQFYRSWERLGRKDSKQVIDAQLSHSVALTHALHTSAAKVSSTFEVDNLTDAKLSDFFGVQKPGRAFYLKTTLEL